jgi:hypothetical protein
MAAAPAAPAQVPSPATQPPGPRGTLQITTLPYADVSDGSTPLGRVTVENIPLSAGRHVLRLVHPNYEPLSRVVNIPEGGTTKLTLDWSEVGVPKK